MKDVILLWALASGTYAVCFIFFGSAFSSASITVYLIFALSRSILTILQFGQVLVANRVFSTTAIVGLEVCASSLQAHSSRTEHPQSLSFSRQ